MMKKILLTGGDGFIARSISAQLCDEYVISSCNRKKLDLLDSLRVREYIKCHQFDVIIHTATYAVPIKYSTKDPSKILENNLKMFFNVSRCKDFFGKMIYFGSGAEFDRENWIPKMKEDYFDQHMPKDQYGFSKYIMTKYAEANSGIYNLRLFGVFGKYDDWRYRFIPNTCRNAVLGYPIRINANASFDYLYIDDLVRIVKWFIDNEPQKKVYNVCTGRAYDLKTLAEKVVDISSKSIEITINSAAIEKGSSGDYSLLLSLGKEYSGDNSRLLNELNGFEFAPIDESIRALYKWYDSNRHIIEKEE